MRESELAMYISVICTVHSFWQKFRENNVFTKEITKLLKSLFDEIFFWGD